MLKISFRRRQGYELTNTARRNENRTHWYRLAGMRRWGLILMVADDNFVSEAEPPPPLTRRRAVMADTEIKTETPADRMRLAVKRLRCDHTYPIQPPHGSLAHPGPCRHCGMPYPGDDEEVPDALRGALVFLLEEIARQYDMPPCDKLDGCCNGCERRDDFVYANGLAQIINGDKGFAR